MKKLLFRITLAALLIILFSGILWRNTDHMLDSLIRPQLETLASKMLDADILIGQLRRTKSGLEILEVQISGAQIKALVPQAALNFTLTSLLKRQLKEVLINNPQVEFKPPSQQENQDNTPLQLPELPLKIEQLTINSGRLDISTATQQLHFHQLNVSGRLQAQSHFSLSAFVGSGEQQPISMVATLEFSPRQNLTLESLSWQGQQLLQDHLSLELSGGELALDGSRISLSRFDNDQLQNIFRALGQASPLPADLKFTLTDAGIKASLEDSALQLELQIAEAQVGWNRLNGSFSTLRMTLTQEQAGWKVAGQFIAPTQAALAFNARIDKSNNISGQAAVTIPAPGALKVALIGGSSLKINGALQLTTDFSWNDRRLNISTAIRGSAPTSPLTDYLFDISRLNGQGKLLLVAGQETFSLSLNQGSQPFVSVSGNFQEFKASLNAANLDMLKQLLRADQLPAQLAQLNGVNIAGKFAARDSSWEGHVDLSTTETLFSGISLKSLTMQTNFKLALKRLIFSAITISAEVEYDDILTGHLTGDASAELSDDGYSLTLEKFTLNDLNYNSVDGLSGVGAAAVALQGRIHGPWSAGSIALDLNGTLAVREVLAGAFYANLSNHQADFSLIGELDTSTGELSAKVLEVTLPQLGKLMASGQFSPDRISSQGHLDLVELSSSYGAQFKPLLGDFQPWLANLDLAGQLALDYRLHWQHSGWQAQGTVILNALNAHWQLQQFEMIDASGRIPFSLGNGTQTDSAASAEKYLGEISFAELSVGPAKAEQRSLQLAAELNRIAVLSPLQLNLAGGYLAIEKVNLGWPKWQPQGAVNIDIAGVSLESLTRDLGLPIMQGSLSANLGTIEYLDRQLNSAGVASLEVFGGRFQFSNMRYSEPFSSHPVFSADIDFTGLDLQQATRTFDFGEMNGILDGNIRGLQLFGTTPAAFEATAATRTSGNRNISVKALNNLSILSQGGISAALSRGIYQFIDFYRYRKIAFECSLVNDTFRLIGTALPGTNRYLVHGGLLPPRIDITTTTPTISFKEMVNRLGRIDRAGSRK